MELEKKAGTFMQDITGCEKFFKLYSTCNRKPNKVKKYDMIGLCF